MINLGIVDKIKAYGFMTLAAILGVLLLVQTGRVFQRGVEIAGLNLSISRLENTLANERLTALQEYADLQAEYRKKEQGLTDRAEQIKKDKNEQVKAVSAERDRLLKRVRDSESRAKAIRLAIATSLTPDGATPYNGDGAELLATIGEEDVEEAQRGDIIRLELLSCYKRYEDARQTIGKVK